MREPPIHAVAPVPTTSMTTASPFPSERTTRHPESVRGRGSEDDHQCEDLAELRGQAHLIRSLSTQGRSPVGNDRSDEDRYAEATYRRTA